MAVVNDVITKFSFIGSLVPMDSFKKKLTKTIGLSAGLVSGIKAASVGVAAWTSVVTESLDPMVQLSRETGVAISFIQEMGFAASQNGSNLEAMQASIKELNKRVGEFSRTGGGPAAEAFLQLGLSVRDAGGKIKTTDRILLDLQNRMQGFNRSEQADILDKLGIDPSLIQLLNQSSDSIDSLRQKAVALGTVTKEQGDAAAALNDANTTMLFGVKSLQNQIAVGLVPTVKLMTEGFIAFLIANKDVIKNGVQALGSAIIELSGFMNRIAPVALTAAAAFVTWKIASNGLAASLSVILAPANLIAAAIVGVAVVVDDLIVAFRGGQSVIRDFILDMTGFDIAPSLRESVKAVKEFTSLVINEFNNLFDAISTGDFSGVWDGLWDSFKNVLGMIYDAFGNLSQWFVGSISDALSSLGGIFSTSGVNETFKESDNYILGFNGGNDGAVDRSTSNSTSTSNVSQSNNINVYTSDPVAAGQAVTDFSTKQLRETRQYFDRGGQ